jgi:hypothetical protein
VLDIGVLADFEGHAHAEDKFKPNGRIDYDALDYSWWATMPAYEGARAFYDAACATAPTRFLTGPVLSEDCYAGKAHWVQGFVPERGKFVLEDLVICDSKSKFLLAAPNRILVDDRISNVKEWEEAGGIGILHTGNFAETLAKVKESVAKIKGPKVSPSQNARPIQHFPNM